MAATDIKITTEESAGIVQQIEEVATIAEAVNTDPAVLESLYALGYRLYNDESYKDAETVFKALCIYNHKDVRFWMGFAGTLQARGKIKDAIDAYSMAGRVDLQDPTPFYYIAWCYLELGDNESAIGALKSLLDRGNTANPDHAACHTKATAVLAILENGGTQG